MWGAQPLNPAATRGQAHCVEFEIDCDLECTIEIYFLAHAIPVQDNAARAVPL